MFLNKSSVNPKSDERLPKSLARDIFDLIAIVVIALLAIFSLCFLIFIIVLSKAIEKDGLGTLLNPPPPPEFCTLDDEVVIAIKEEHSQWEMYFRDNASSLGYPPTLQIALPSGETYEVDARRWDIGESAPVLYITTQIRWPNTAEYGNTGYFYAPEGHLERVVGQRLKVKPLTTDIYCYWWNYDI